MSAQTRTRDPGFDEAGLELPFASFAPHEEHDYPNTIGSFDEDERGHLHSETEFDVESSDRWDGEELAWLDVESPTLEEELQLEREVQHGVQRLPWLAGELDIVAEQPTNEAAVDRFALETLLDRETGVGSGLAERVKGVTEFVLGPTLRHGSSGAGVMTLQRILVALGHGINVDGSFGPATDRSVRAFQSRANIEADGVVGPRTKTALAAALGQRPLPAPPTPPLPTPPPTPPRPHESVDDFAARLGAEWSRRKNGTPSADEFRSRLRADYDDTLQGARLRWGSKVSEDEVRRAWMVSREEEMRFKTEQAASVKPLGAFGPPAAHVALVSDARIAGSDVAPVAPIMVRFVEALRRRFPGASAANYRGHGGGSFNNRGYSLDLYIPGRDARGFYPVASAIQFLRAVDAASKELAAQWRVIYNDFTAADAINRETGRANVIFVGNVRRDKGNRVAGLNWHGPHPLILHFHLDLAPSSSSPQREYEDPGRDEWLDRFESRGDAFAQDLASFAGHVDQETAADAGVNSADVLALGATLQLGSSGAAVETLQRALVSLGAGVSVDGAFGPQTDRAVRNFQSRSGLQVDGIVGPATKAALAAALGGVRPGPAPTPPRPPSGVKAKVAQFIARYGPAARKSEAASRIPALVILGQAAVESGWGERFPGNNLFGVKASPSDPESTRQLLVTKEHHADPDRKYPDLISVTRMPNGWYEYTIRAWFRRYPNTEASFAHHAAVLQKPRYAKAFQHLDDPYAFAAEVVRGGYATGKQYLEVLTQVMRMIEASGGY